MSEDDRWNDVIDQVLDALDDAEVSDPGTRDALAEGVKAALDSLESGIGLDVQIIGEGFPEATEPSPKVEVMAGGRTDDEPPSAGEKPALRIADPDELDSPSPDETEHSVPVFTHVNVRHNRSQTPPKVNSGLAEAGWIRVAPGGAPEAAWQTIYRGQSPRLYRVACSSGSLDVTVDGEPVERLLPGQSIDAEGSAIRVTTTEDGGAIGGYSPIHITGSEE